MQLKREVEYHSSTDTIDRFKDFYLEWPLDTESNNKLIVACDSCFYPITFEEHIVDEIRNDYLQMLLVD